MYVDVIIVAFVVVADLAVHMITLCGQKMQTPVDRQIKTAKLLLLLEHQNFNTVSNNLNTRSPSPSVTELLYNFNAIPIHTPGVCNAFKQADKRFIVVVVAVAVVAVVVVAAAAAVVAMGASAAVVVAAVVGVVVVPRKTSAASPDTITSTPAVPSSICNTN